MIKRLLGLVVGICLLASCSESEKEAWPNIEAMQVNINSHIGKTAKFEITLSSPHEVYLDYWKTEQIETLNTIHLQEDDYAMTAILYGLEENTSYQYKIRFDAEDALGSQIHNFKTQIRDDAVKQFYLESENEIETDLDGTFLFHRTGHPSVILLVNGKGQVVWYRTSPNMIKVANLTHRNTILTIESSSEQDFSDGDRILETNLAGDTLLLLNYGENDFNKIPHHDLFLTQENNIVMLTQEVQNEFKGDGILVLDRNGQKLWEWSSFGEFSNPDLATYVQPWGNSIVEDEKAYYVSFRALSQVWKINKISKSVDWKLGQNGDFNLDPDTQFLFQHFAHFNQGNELLLFDNGATENRTYSRILSIELAEDSQSLSPKTNIQLPAEYFSPFMGSVQQLNNNEFLVCSATNGTILNVNLEGNILWKLTASDRMYRCVYIEKLF